MAKIKTKANRANQIDVTPELVEKIKSKLRATPAEIMAHPRHRERPIGISPRGTVYTGRNPKWTPPKYAPPELTNENLPIVQQQKINKNIPSPPPVLNVKKAKRSEWTLRSKKDKYNYSKPLADNSEYEAPDENVLSASKLNGVQGPVFMSVKKRQYIYNSERLLRDRVIGHTEEGKRIFAFNSEGTPICFSKKPNQPENKRCQSVNTMFNGRCKYHGGRAPSGLMHWRNQHLRTSDNLPKFLQEDMRKAQLDPDLHDMSHELQLLDVYEKELKQSIGKELDGYAAKKIMSLMISLEYELDKNGCVAEEFLRTLIKTYHAGRNNEATWNKIRSLALDRAKIADSSFKREKELKQMLRHDQAMQLVTAVAATCRSEIATVISKIEKKYILIERGRVTTEQRKRVEEVVPHAFVSNIDDAIRVNFQSKISAGIATSISGSPARAIGAKENSTTPTNEDVINAEFNVKEDE